MVKNLKKIVSIFLSTAMLSAYTGGVLAAEETAVGYAYLDLGEYYNSDFIGDVGQTIDPTTWMAGALTDSGCKTYTNSWTNRGIASAEFIGGSYTLPFNGKKIKDGNGALGYTSTDTMSFEIDSEKLASGVNDAIALEPSNKNWVAAPKAVQSITIPTSGWNSKGVYFSALGVHNDNSVAMKATMNYSDNTTEEITLTIGTAGKLHNAVDNCGYGNGKTRYFLTPNSENVLIESTEKTSGRAIGFYELPVSAGKTLTSVTFDRQPENGLWMGVAAIFSMTEVITEDNTTLTEYLSAFDTNGVDFESGEDVAALKKAIAAIEALSSRGEDVSAYSAITDKNAEYKEYNQNKEVNQKKAYIQNVEDVSVNFDFSNADNIIAMNTALGYLKELDEAGVTTQEDYPGVRGLSAKYDEYLAEQSKNEKIAFLDAIDVEEINKNFIKPSNITKLITAFAYIAELEEVGYDVSKYSNITALKSKYDNYIEYKDYQKLHNYIDLSKYYNADVLGKIGDTVDRNTWFAGRTDQYYNYGITSTNMYTNTSNNTTSYSDGIFTLLNNSRGYDNNDIKNTVEMRFKIDETGLSGGVKDSIYLTGTGNGTAQTSPNGYDEITIPASALPVSRLLFTALGYTGDNQTLVVKLNYTDGTSVSVTRNIVAAEHVSHGTKGKSLEGYWNWTGDRARLTPNNDTAVLEQDGTAVLSAMGAFAIDADTGKRLDSITFSIDKTHGTYGDIAIFALTEEYSASVYDLYEGISELQKTVASADDIITKEHKETIYKARRYADELIARSLETEATYSWIDAYVTQVEALNEVYIDLAKLVNSDLILAEGETKSADASYQRNETLYMSARSGSSSISEDGIITIKASGDEDTLNEDGRTFKLSGNYLHSGNDAVLIANDSLGTTVELDGKILSEISVITDSIEGNTSQPDTLNATVTYTDGTTEEIAYAGRFKVNSPYLYRNYATSETHFGAGYFDENGKLAHDGTAEVTRMYAAKIAVNAKPVKSVKFEVSDAGEYSILAVTEVPMTNAELIAKLASVFEITENNNWSENEENAKAVLEGCYAYEELAKRGSAHAEQDLAAFIAGFKSEAQSALGITEGNIKPVFNVAVKISDTKATAEVTMTNETESAQNYIIIIAAYGENNRLLDVKHTSEKKSLAPGAKDITDSISIDKVDGAVKYKGMIWDSLENLIPLAYSEG